jgi:hypothetical protein
MTFTPTPTRTSSPTATMPDSCAGTLSLGSPYGETYVGSNPTVWVIGIQNTTNTKVNFQGFDFIWSGTQQATSANLEGTTIKSFSPAQSSPALVTLASTVRFGNWDYKAFKLVFNAGFNMSDITYAKFYFDNGCFVVYGAQ